MLIGACNPMLCPIWGFRHLSRDQDLLRLFNRSDRDIFTEVATELKRKEATDPVVISHAERQQAKAICYGIIYGQTQYGLARETGMTEAAALSYIKAFLGKYNTMAAYLDSVRSAAKRTGQSVTIQGRPRKLNFLTVDELTHSKAERQAVNTTVQGSAADIVKVAVIEVDKEITILHKDHRKRDGKARKADGANAAARSRTRGPALVMMMHDELIYQVPEGDDGVEAVRLIKRTMERTVRQKLALRVPLVVEINVGKIWGNLEPFRLEDEL